jgi:nucleoside-diphosphate-sugar epimerase
MNYILGSSGLIGTAIIRELDEQNSIVVPRNEYENWIKPDRIRTFLRENQVNASDSFYVCSGVTNPTSNRNLLQLHNCDIPLSILKESIERDYRVITFGSIQENFSVLNNYIDSKKEFLKQSTTIGELPNHVHFQMHTIYGFHMPKNYMLLGMVLEAIRSNSCLKMTSGKQFREYWHATDVAKFVVSENWNGNPDRVTPISSGHPLRIKDLVTAIFDKFSLSGLLRLGSLSDDPNEAYTFDMFTPSIAARYMRDPVHGVHEYLESCLTGAFNER